LLEKPKHHQLDDYKKQQHGRVLLDKPAALELQISCQQERKHQRRRKHAYVGK
jgi:hypothetical protein